MDMFDWLSVVVPGEGGDRGPGPGATDRPPRPATHSSSGELLTRRQITMPGELHRGGPDCCSRALSANNIVFSGI